MPDTAPLPADVPDRAATREERRERFRLDRVRALTALLRSRAELRGVSAMADHLDDGVRWSV